MDSQKIASIADSLGFPTTHVDNGMQLAPAPMGAEDIQTVETTWNKSYTVKAVLKNGQVSQVENTSSGTETSTRNTWSAEEYAQTMSDM